LLSLGLLSECMLKIGFTVQAEEEPVMLPTPKSTQYIFYMFLQYYQKFYHCCDTECHVHLKVGHTPASFPGLDGKLHARVRYCDLKCLPFAFC
jgi:hypothetical protein